MHPRHVVMATGVSGIPNLPRYFRPEKIRGHNSAFQRIPTARTWKGKRALVIGTGNSGHDIAQDLDRAAPR